MPSISVILVSFQQGSVLPISVQLALQQADVGEVLLMDNGNASETMEQLRALAAQDARLKIISGQGNIGFTAACNKGAQLATGEYLCLMQGDVFLNADTLATLRQQMNAHGSAAMAAPLVLNADGSEQKGGRMRFLTPQLALAEATKLYRFRRATTRVFLHKTPQPTSTEAVDALGFACLLLRKETFQSLGGLDEGYFLHFADQDFAQRAAKAGVARLFVPQAVAVHLHQSSRLGLVDYEWRRRKGFQRYIGTYAVGTSLPVQWAMLALTLLWLALKLVRIRVGAYLPESKGAKAMRRMVLLYRYLLQGAPAEAPLAGQTMLLTGATNQVGVCVLGRLLAQGVRVLAVSHQTQVPFRHPQLHWIEGDLRQGKLAIPAEFKPDVMIHAAELWLLPPAMPAISGSSIKRVIAFGSAKVFTKVYADHSREQAEVERLEQAEINAVKACRQNGIRWTIFRPTMIYGVGLDNTVMRIADAARRFGLVLIDPPAKGRRQPVHADDLAQAVISAIGEKKCLDKAYNLSGGEVLEYRAMIERIMVALGRTPRVIDAPFLPDWLDKLGRFLGKPNVHGEHLRQMNQDMTLPYNEARTDFGYLPRTFLSNGAADLGRF